jgi:hypothetical protein
MKLNAAQLRAGELKDADAIARLVNEAFRPERFFIDGDAPIPRTFAS